MELRSHIKTSHRAKYISCCILKILALWHILYFLHQLPIDVMLCIC